MEVTQNNDRKIIGEAIWRSLSYEKMFLGETNQCIYVQLILIYVFRMRILQKRLG